MTPRFLILGGSSFIGQRLQTILGAENTLATYNSTPVEGGVHFDASYHQLADQVLKAHKGFTHAFLFLGVTNLDFCARNPMESARINVDAIQNIIVQLRNEGITPIFASSDAVFDGTHGGWTENDAVCPTLTYGHQKAAVESFMLAHASPGIVVRLPKVLSTTPGVQGVLDGWLNDLEGGVEIRCAQDQIFSPIEVDEAVRAMITLVNAEASGAFHFAAPQAVSRLELLEMLARAVERRHPIRAKISPCSIRDFAFAEPRPLNTSMSAAKVEAVLGWHFSDLQHLCAQAAMRRYPASVPRMTA